MKKPSKAQRLLTVLEGFPEVAVLTHDNPDPDAIASGWGLCVFVETVLGAKTRFLARGAITRAENRTLVDVLKPPLSLVEHWPDLGQAAVALVDTASVPSKESWAVRAVIDHHAAGRRPVPCPFRDIRRKVVATSSIITSYLREFAIEPAPSLATALTYGVYSDAKGRQIRFSRADRAALTWLAEFSDPELLSTIESAPLSRRYFEDLLLALENCFVHGTVGVCCLAQASGAEAVGEIADLVIRCEEVDRALCAASLDGRLVLSARTTPAGGGDASDLLARTLDQLPGASCGGHRHRAGGLVKAGSSARGLAGLTAQVRQRWLEVNGVDSVRGRRLVARRRILRALESQ